MKQHLSVFAALTLALSALVTQAATNETESAEAKYTATITKRSADIVDALFLSDGAKAQRVQAILVAQYRALNTWHEQHDGELKKLSKDTNAVAKAQATQVQSSVKKIHKEFLAKLATELQPAQIDTIKDKMTYGKVKVTYDGYVEIVPNLTDAEKARILELLKEAREEAMDGGSADEKSAIFKRYKGKINIYLSAQGHDVSKAYKDWGAKQKEKKTVAP
ncbi:MAG: hypothetical protein RLY20_314 [Verrucomicrobiota bacterium]|jgi:uncharacterized protein YdbL (DUF1318 family)